MHFRAARGRRDQYQRLQGLPSSSLSLVLDEALSIVTGTGSVTVTASSSYTIPGPGALAGKLVKAAGELILSIFEDLIIKHRIWRLKRLFKASPTSGNRVHLDEKKVCRDLVELTRSGYSRSTRETAFGLLVFKLLGPYSTVSGSWFRNLVEEVSNLHPTLITDFFMELSALIRPEDDDYTIRRKFLYSSDILRSDNYLQSRNLSGRKTIMTFTLHVIYSNETAAQAVIDGGLLEVLVDVVSHGFKGWDSDSIDNATEVLSTLSGYPSILRLMKQHDIACCWPRCVPGLRPSIMEIVEMEEEQDFLL